MPRGRFGTAILCIDGRIQQPTADWLKDRYHLDHVDMVTAPGADRALAEGPAELVEHLKTGAHLSVTRHSSSVVAIVGHGDCAANPVPREEHLIQIANAVQVVRFWNLSVTLVCLWVDDNWHVQELGE